MEYVFQRLGNGGPASTVEFRRVATARRAQEYGPEPVPAREWEWEHGAAHGTVVLAVTPSLYATAAWRFGAGYSRARQEHDDTELKVDTLELDNDSDEELHAALVLVAKAHLHVRVVVVDGAEVHRDEGASDYVTDDEREIGRALGSALRDALCEAERLKLREEELLERNSRLLDEKRANSLRNQVTAFHLKYGHPVCSYPAVPADRRVRFRLKLICEELGELLAACCDDEKVVEAVRRELSEFVLGAPLKVDLPAAVDAVADLKYVLEGTYLELGVDGDAVGRLVHEANMTKGDNDPGTGKPRKNPGWVPPDIAGELRRQGEG